MTSRTIRVLMTAGAATALAVSAGTTATAAPAASCYASGGALYCGNSGNAPIYAHPQWSTPSGNPQAVVDRLVSTFSYFKCYTTGDSHAGGNNVWYYTYGDNNGKWGYVPANLVYTPVDPFPGVTHC